MAEHSVEGEEERLGNEGYESMPSRVQFSETAPTIATWYDGSISSTYHCSRADLIQIRDWATGWLRRETG